MSEEDDRVAEFAEVAGADDTVTDEEITVLPEEVAAEEAAPRAPVRDETTGSYRTLQGYQVARETLERMYVGKGRTTERTFVLASLRFFLIDLGSNMTGADDLVQRFHAWIQQPENQRVVETALGWDKNPP